jgi:hypothetical protein
VYAVSQLRLYSYGPVSGKWAKLRNRESVKLQRISGGRGHRVEGAMPSQSTADENDDGIIMILTDHLIQSFEMDGNNLPYHFHE